MDFLLQYKILFSGVAWGSLIVFFVSLTIIPWMVIKIPTNYFQQQHRAKVYYESKYLAMTKFLTWIKNIFGLLLIVLGLMMLVLPGQGILTILMGLFLMDFPGKYRLERKLVSMPKVLNSLNWIRTKANKAPLII